ncbi:MAG TPA: MAPEG family protein [Rhizomicrobium sp.]|nr:MAPEG family protein [Rhizomicrobium sp.]
MELASKAYLLSAIATIVALILYVVMFMRVGSARTKYKIDAPAVTGDPVFERTYRVQMNTLEHLPIFLPLLWLATIYFTRLGWLPAAFGFIWIVGRFLYMQGYIAEAGKRSTGFLVAAVAELALLILAVVGIAMAWTVS